jgi:hypothetical protein
MQHFSLQSSAARNIATREASVLSRRLRRVGQRTALWDIGETLGPPRPSPGDDWLELDRVDLPLVAPPCYATIWFEPTR